MLGSPVRAITAAAVSAVEVLLERIESMPPIPGVEYRPVPGWTFVSPNRRPVAARPRVAHDLLGHASMRR